MHGSTVNASLIFLAVICAILETGKTSLSEPPVKLIRVEIAIDFLLETTMNNGLADRKQMIKLHPAG
jgi:hypothetical protein